MSIPPENNLSDILSRRPLQAYQRLFSALEDNGHAFSLAPGESAEKNVAAESTIWLITRGVFTVVRESDASWLGTASAPFIVGISGLFSTHGGGYSLMAQNSCQGIGVERDLFFNASTSTISGRTWRIFKRGYWSCCFSGMAGSLLGMRTRWSDGSF